MFTSRMAGMHGSNRYRTNIGGFNQGDESCGQFSIKYVQEDNLKWQGYSFYQYQINFELIYSRYMFMLHAERVRTDAILYQHLLWYTHEKKTPLSCNKIFAPVPFSELSYN